MKNRFTQKAEHALEGALTAAREMGHTYIGSEHLLLALLHICNCIRTLHLFSTWKQLTNSPASIILGK